MEEIESRTYKPTDIIEKHFNILYKVINNYGSNTKNPFYNNIFYILLEALESEREDVANASLNTINSY